jgi:hypothetical protein
MEYEKLEASLQVKIRQKNYDTDQQKEQMVML